MLRKLLVRNVAMARSLSVGSFRAAPRRKGEKSNGWESLSDPYAVGGSFFSPAVIRHFKRAREDMAAGRLRKPVARRALVNSDNFLRYLAQKAHKTRGNNIRRNIIATHISKPDTFHGLGSLESDAELQACAAAAIILLPEALETWRQLDAVFAKAIEQRAAWGDFQSFEVPLLCSYSLLVACSERGLNARQFKTPSLVMKLLSDKCNIDNTLDSIFPLQSSDSQAQLDEELAEAWTDPADRTHPSLAAAGPMLETSETHLGLDLPIGGSLESSLLEMPIGLRGPSSPVHVSRKANNSTNPATTAITSSTTKATTTTAPTKSRRSNGADVLSSANAALTSLVTPDYDETTAREALDQIAVCMFTMAWTQPRVSREYNKLLLSLVSHNCSKALAALQPHAASPSASASTWTAQTGSPSPPIQSPHSHPTQPIHVELGALRHIWESAAELQLPNAYPLYKNLYETALRSLQMNPLQIANREEDVATLLESMVKSRFKNSKLIVEVGAIIKAQGSRFETCGARLFNSLVALDNMGLALELLDRMMKRMSEMPKSSRVLYGSSFGAGRGGHSFLSLSEEGLLRIEDFLEANGAGKGGYTSSSLMLALYCFSREERWSRYYHLLESVEAEAASKVPSMTLHEVLNAFHTYGSVTRLQPQLLRAITVRVEEALPTMNKVELQTVLWAHARLNLHNAYVPRAGQLFFARFSPDSGVRLLSASGYRQVIVTLWSLAVLQALSYEQYLIVEPLLLDFYNKKRMQRPLHECAEPALLQVLAELRLAKLGDGASLTPAASSLRPQQPTVPGGAARVAASLAVDEALSLALSATAQQPAVPSVWAERPWERVQPQIPPHFKSSASHLKLSQCLTQMSVAHHNEAEIGYGYVVDILIPAAPGLRYATSSGRGHEGKLPADAERKSTIIEVDGPYHFESYLQQPIGPTAMKRRHLQALGHRVISVPYTSWTSIRNDGDKIKQFLHRLLAAADKPEP